MTAYLMLVAGVQRFSVFRSIRNCFLHSGTKARHMSLISRNSGHTVKQNSIARKLITKLFGMYSKKQKQMSLNMTLRAKSRICFLSIMNPPMGQDVILAYGMAGLVKGR